VQLALSIKHQVSLNGDPQPFYLLENFCRKVKLKFENLKKEVILREKIVNNSTILKNLHHIRYQSF
jgi:hypothetical protein